MEVERSNGGGTLTTIQMLEQPKLSAYFLGGVKLLWQGRLLSQFATQKVLGLFCYLLDTPDRSISRDKLITIFWDESSERFIRLKRTLSCVSL